MFRGCHRKVKIHLDTKAAYRHTLVMKRISLFFQQDQLDRMNKEATRTGSPVAEIIRRAVEAYLPPLVTKTEERREAFRKANPHLANLPDHYVDDAIFDEIVSLTRHKIDVYKGSSGPPPLIDITDEDRASFRKQSPGMTLSDTEVDILIQLRKSETK